MFITVITDCIDQNAQARLGTRIAGLFDKTPTIIGVGGNLKTENAHDPAEYQAAGCLIDAIDAALNYKGVILVNVANRHGKGKVWPNGTPFGYFWINNALIVATIDGITLSLIKKLKLATQINVLDIPTVTYQLVENKIIDDELRHQLISTQFRSYEFQPRVAKWLMDGINIPNEPYAISHIPSISNAIWYVDNFGNCKTTLLAKDINFADGKIISTNLGQINCVSRLKDVEEGKPAFIIGSSGYKTDRFVELVIQGKNAAHEFKLNPSSEIIIY